MLQVQAVQKSPYSKISSSAHLSEESCFPSHLVPVGSCCVIHLNDLVQTPLGGKNVALTWLPIFAFVSLHFVQLRGSVWVISMLPSNQMDAIHAKAGLGKGGGV